MKYEDMQRLEEAIAEIQRLENALKEEAIAEIQRLEDALKEIIDCGASASLSRKIALQALFQEPK